MSFFEVETWVPRAGYEASHDDIIRRWFDFVREHHDALFPEFKSARYYRQVDRYTGQPTGRYMMIFEYYDHERFLAYKERRKDWSGPYAEYKKVDPYQEHFDLETVTEAYYESAEAALWLNYGDRP